VLKATADALRLLATVSAGMRKAIAGALRLLATVSAGMRKATADALWLLASAVTPRASTYAVAAGHSNHTKS
jgi:hypothetical protein